MRQGGVLQEVSANYIDGYENSCCNERRLVLLEKRLCATSNFEKRAGCHKSRIHCRTHGLGGGWELDPTELSLLRFEDPEWFI
jgi:hypothetical protein